MIMVAQVQSSPLFSKETSKHYSPEEYLALETLSDERHEFRDGNIIPMTGGTPNHNRLIRNLCSLLTWALKKQNFEVFVSDQRLWLPQKNIHTYPDLMIIQGELEFQEGRKDTIMNPLLIVEVLSKSTQNYDRGDRFAAYRTIPDFQEYLLIDQYSQQVEQYTRQSEKQWLFKEQNTTDKILNLSSVNLEVAIADIYDKVEFDAIQSSQ